MRIYPFIINTVYKFRVKPHQHCHPEQRALASVVEGSSTNERAQLSLCKEKIKEKASPSDVCWILRRRSLKLAAQDDSISNYKLNLYISLLINCLLIASVEGQQQKIQDTQKAIEYFTTEMKFTASPHEVNLAITSHRKNFTVVDVRDRKAYAAGHIPGAINLPVGEYNFDGNDTNFPGLRTDGFNYVYCYALLCDLSQRAAIKFASLGYPVKEMKGGFQSWKDHGYPVEK